MQVLPQLLDRGYALCGTWDVDRAARLRSRVHANESIEGDPDLLAFIADDRVSALRDPLIDVYATTVTVQLVPPGRRGHDWHRDPLSMARIRVIAYENFGRPKCGTTSMTGGPGCKLTPRTKGEPGCLVFALALDDFSTKSGATQLIPTDEGTEEQAVSLEMPAGSMAAFAGSHIRHRSGFNASTSARAGVFVGFYGHWKGTP
ncbi:MAG: hypothetical protein AB7T06_39575 [Kofleriaceae bacterium]